MGKLVAWIEGVALGLGAPGLFIVALLDSSFLALPEVVDLLLIFMVTKHKARMPLYAAAAVVGSIVGCLMLYYVGRKGDEFIARRFGAKRVERTLGHFRRYGIMAVLIPSLLPPPAPFKLFVLLAGVAGISPTRFIVAVGLGRGIRFFGEGMLAVWYGDLAVEFLRTNGRAVSLGLAVFVSVALGGYLLWKKSTAPGRR
ncbi:MAG: YqaA family protein [Vicinamibacterales bacterium]